MKRLASISFMLALIIFFTFIFGCASTPHTPDATFTYNPLFECTFENAWDAALVCLSECEVYVTDMDQQSGWIKGWFTEWDKGAFATYFINISINETSTMQNMPAYRILVNGSFMATSPIAALKAKGYLKRRILRIQTTITQKLREGIQKKEGSALNVTPTLPTQNIACMRLRDVVAVGNLRGRDAFLSQMPNTPYILFLCGIMVNHQ